MRVMTEEVRQIIYHPIVISIAVPFVFTAGFYLLRKTKYFGAPAGPAKLDQKTYQDFNTKYSLFFIMVLVALGVPSSLLLLGLRTWTLKQVPQSAILYAENNLGLLFAGGVMLMLLPAGLIAEKIMIGRHKKLVEDYMHDSNVRYKMNTKRVAVLLLGMLTILLSPGTYIFTFDYTYLDSKNLRYFENFKEEIKPISEISQIVRFKKFKAPNGNVIDRVSHIVTFKSGDRWQRDGNWQDLFERLSKASGVSISQSDQILE